METTVKKNQTAELEKYSYKYVDIAKIHEYLESKGMSYWQYIETYEGHDFIMTVPVIDGKELPPRRGCRVVDATLVCTKNPAQEQGSALTYARRYSLLMAFGLATEDDDAQCLSRPKEDEKATEKQIAYLKQVYTGENWKKLLDANGIVDITELPKAKASDLISRIKERENVSRQ